MLKKAFIVVFVVVLLSLSVVAIRADEYDDLSKQLDTLKKSLESSQKATQTNEQNLKNLNAQFNSIKAQVYNLEVEIGKKEQEVKKGEEQLSYQKNILDHRTISYYKNMGKDSLSLIDILIAEDLSKSVETFFYQKSLLDQNRKAIIQTALYVKEVEDKKTSLLKEQQRLSVIKAEVDRQAQFLAKEVEKSKTFESQLKSQIASLSARQQQIVAQKQSSLNLPVSAGSSAKGCTDDRAIDPGFSPAFAFFTFGVPNRVGMNQYGAWGRAKAGQNYDQILHAYYNFDNYQDWDQNTQIKVNDSNGYNSGNIIWTGSVEDYVKRIYEIPDSWTDGDLAALKAQTIAARSYVLAQTDNGSKSICATEYCQVFKTDPKGGNWNSAASGTAGKVMVQGGKPITAYFSSTHGGYIFSSGDIGWSSTGWTKNARDFEGDVGSFQDLLSKAYDKDSPWFYCDWGGRKAYNNTAWLKSDELADITNALMLAKADSGTSSHLCQTDTAACPDTWDANKVKDELRNRGKSPFNSVSGVNIDWDKGSGRTTSIAINGDAGSQSFSPKEWKDFFNLRAPANIQIVGPLYNVEKR